MKSLLLMYILFSFHSSAVENDLPIIQLKNIDFFDVLRKSGLNVRVSPIQDLGIEDDFPPYILRSIDRERNSSFFCGGNLIEELPPILYHLELRTTAYEWIPIDDKVVKTQHWITSP